MYGTVVTERNVSFATYICVCVWCYYSCESRLRASRLPGSYMIYLFLSRPRTPVETRRRRDKTVYVHVS